MKLKYWYYKGSDIIGTGNEEQEAKEQRAKKRKAKAQKMQKRKIKNKLKETLLGY